MIRAIADDQALAEAMGVPIERSILLAFGIGSAIAGVAAVLVAYDTSFSPTMGFHALLFGVVAAIVGGIGSISGALLGGLLIGFAENFGVWRLPTQWQDTIVFVILVLFLVLRPEGFMGLPLRKTEV